MEKELFEIIKALQEFRNIIYETEVRIFSDNRNATFLKTSTSARVLRWKTIIDKHNYTPNHISGKENQIQCSIY